MSSLDKENIYWLNILHLLKDEPKTWIQLWKSGAFLNPKFLCECLGTLIRVGCIEATKISPHVHLLSLTEMGRKFVEEYDFWEVRKVNYCVHDVPGYTMRALMEQEFVIKLVKGVYHIPSVGKILVKKTKANEDE